MDIYKLKDFEKGSKRLVFDGDASENTRRHGDILKITEMKTGVKNPERVNVYVDGTYEFSLDVAQVVEFKIKVGREISAEELVRLKQESEFSKMYQRTLQWVLMRPRSIRETKDYLSRLFRKSSSGSRRFASVPEESSEIIQQNLCSSEDFSNLSKRTIDRLISRGYLDDEKFAKWWMENRFVRKGVSQRRLRIELADKGVAKEIIERVLDVRDDTVEIRKIIEKKRAKYTDEKLMAYLCRQGFSYELVREMVERGDDG